MRRDFFIPTTHPERDYWEGQLGKKLADGSFGENLTITGVDTAALERGTGMGDMDLAAQVVEAQCLPPSHHDPLAARVAKTRA
ncbi:MAG: hypothetical protein SOW59_09805 [Corynebacterium sp.]|nr:hypothetical protein [Corynebacterium sp.]